MVGDKVIIGLVGPKRVGKDTFATQLLREGVRQGQPGYWRYGTRASFAERLRKAASACYGLEGPQDLCGAPKMAPGLFWDEAKKETPQAALNGRTPREVLIHLGASMRAVDLDVWCRGAFEDVDNVLRYPTPYSRLGVITDMRFENELNYGRQWCADNGWRFYTVALYRDAAPAPGVDSADTSAVELRELCDIHVFNDHDFARLTSNAKAVLGDIARGYRP